MSSPTEAAWYELPLAPGGDFVCEHRVRFSDCDPAGIVFYPNYFVMLNGVVEDWFSSLGAPWDTYHMVRRMGCPTAQLDSTFLTPSRLGEKLAFHLRVEHIGKSALLLQHRIVGPDGTLRWCARQRIVATSLDTHRSTPWPDDIRTAMHRFTENL